MYFFLYRSTVNLLRLFDGFLDANLWYRLDSIIRFHTHHQIPMVAYRKSFEFHRFLLCVRSKLPAFWIIDLIATSKRITLGICNPQIRYRASYFGIIASSPVKIIYYLSYCEQGEHSCTIWRKKKLCIHHRYCRIDVTLWNSMKPNPGRGASFSILNINYLCLQSVM